MHETTTGIADTLRSRINELKIIGGISADNVLSIEELIGVNLITAQKDIKRFTVQPSGTNFEFTMETLGAYLDNVKLTDIITEADVAQLAADYVNGLDSLINNLETLIGVPASTLELIIDEKVANFYVNSEDNIEERLVNVAMTEPIWDIFLNRKEYLSRVWSSDKGISNFNCLMDRYTYAVMTKGVNLTGVPAIFGGMLEPETFRSRLLSGDIFCKKQLTMADVTTIIRNLPQLLMILKDMPRTYGSTERPNNKLTVLTKALNGEFSYSYPVDPTDPNKQQRIFINTMKNIIAALNDPEAELIIKLFALLR